MVDINVSNMFGSCASYDINITSTSLKDQRFIYNASVGDLLKIMHRYVVEEMLMNILFVNAWLTIW